MAYITKEIKILVSINGENNKNWASSKSGRYFTADEIKEAFGKIRAEFVEKYPDVLIYCGEYDPENNTGDSGWVIDNDKAVEYARSIHRSNSPHQEGAVRAVEIEVCERICGHLDG